MPISVPPKITTPWATSGLKNSIPAAADPINGLAGYDQGFPAINMTPKTAGGIPPFGQDFNGVFFDITKAVQFLQAGGSFPYDSAWATAVGGYPVGALVSRTDNQGFWRNTTPNNTTDPESGGAGWQPEGSGITPVAMAAANIVLTPLQAARDIIVISGSISANLQLIFPSYQKQWTVINNASGAFSVTCKTASGSGIAVANGSIQSVYGNGADILSSSATQLQQSVRGSFSGLAANASGTNANVSVTTDELMLEASAGDYRTARAVSVTPSVSVSGVNGIDSGVVAPSTWYYVWVISNGLNIAGLISLSPTAPSMPSGYTYKARVSTIRTDSTANAFPLPFVQFGRKSFWTPKPATNLTSLRVMASGAQGNISTPTWVAVSVSSFVPPTAASIEISVGGTWTTGTAYQIMAAPNNGYGAISSSANPPPIADNNLNQTLQANSRRIRGLMALETSNIYVASTPGSGTCELICLGWEDNL